MKNLIAIILCAFSQSQFYAAEYWQKATATFANCGKWTFDTQGEIRFRKIIDEGYHFQIREKNRYEVSKFLELAIGPLFVVSKGIKDAFYMDEYRLELEINPSWKINSNVSMRFRNRLDIRKKEKASRLEERIRARQMLVFPCKGRLIDYRPSNETFYDFTSSRFTENRFIPFEITLKISDRMLFRPFVMIKTTYQNLHYKNEIVIGSDCIF